MSRDEDLDRAIEKTVRVEELAGEFARKPWYPIGVLGAANRNRSWAAAVASRVEASGNCGGVAREGAMYGVPRPCASLLEYLCVAGVV